MSNHDKKQKHDENGGVNPVAAAVAGAVVGAAAVGIAGAAVMANDDSRKKLENVIDDAKDNVAGVKADVEKKIAEGQEKVNEVVSAVKDFSQGGVDDTK